MGPSKEDSFDVKLIYRWGTNQDGICIILVSKTNPPPGILHNIRIADILTEKKRFFRSYCTAIVEAIELGRNMK